jgi:hypothetical protein
MPLDLKEAKMRGERLPGAEKSTKCGGQQQQTEQVEEDDTSGCYICTAKFYDS